MRNPLSTRDERFLRVLKLRGSAYLEGLHAFRIGAGGLEIFPRLVSPEIPESTRSSRRGPPTGIEGLDPLLGGGLWRGSTTLVAGPTGAGKTTAGLQFVLEGVRRGEAVPLRQLPGEPDAARPLACATWAPTSRTSGVAACT